MDKTNNMLEIIKTREIGLNGPIGTSHVIVFFADPLVIYLRIFIRS